LPSASADVSRRGPSSWPKVTCRISWLPFEGVATVNATGTISSAKRPASMAAIALRWLSRAKASCASRLIFEARAWFSATSPFER